MLKPDGVKENQQIENEEQSIRQMKDNVISCAMLVIVSPTGLLYTT